MPENHTIKKWHFFLLQRSFLELVLEMSQHTGNKLYCFFLAKVVRPWRRMRFVMGVSCGWCFFFHQVVGWQLGMEQSAANPRQYSLSLEVCPHMFCSPMYLVSHHYAHTAAGPIHRRASGALHLQDGQVCSDQGSPRQGGGGDGGHGRAPTSACLRWCFCQ